MTTQAGILDLGIGNTLALVSMSKNQGFSAELVSNPNSLANYSHLILPGVGNYSRGVEALDQDGFRDSILRFAASGKPLLGICLGMQLLGTSSDESVGQGLSLIKFKVQKLPSSAGTKVPHIGWNFVETIANSKLLGEEKSLGIKFYFNHGFALMGFQTPESKGITKSGAPFTSVIEAGNVMGVQFHPEKSHVFGMRLLNRFLSL